MITPAIMARLHKYAARGDETSMAEVLHDGGLTELLGIADDAIKLAAKAMTGGNVTTNDVRRLDALCKLIGHEP
jgi:hypothetical protein